jgi:uncharacterized protein (DUF924 family)
MHDWQPLIDFWFGELDNGLASAATRKRWFAPDSNFDRLCKDEFGHLLELADTSALDHWHHSAQGQLAYILLTDQLPRNIFRGTAQAFRWDPLALEIARKGLQADADRQLALDERSFFYMPFEHSETLLDQHLAVGLFTYLRDTSPKQSRDVTGNTLRFAQQHRDIILKFGRFPHRNEALGRQSSQAERDFIAAGDGFGQISAPS